LKVRTLQFLDLFRRRRLKGRLFFRCYLRIELPSRSRIDAVSTADALAGAVWQPEARQIRMAVRQSRWRTSGRHDLDRVLCLLIIGGAILRLYDQRKDEQEGQDCRARDAIAMKFHFTTPNARLGVDPSGADSPR